MIEKNSELNFENHISPNSQKEIEHYDNINFIEEQF